MLLLAKQITAAGAVSISQMNTITSGRDSGKSGMQNNGISNLL